MPLVARGRVLGVITWVSAESERLYTADDLALAEDLAKRAAIAIDNAELHSETLAAAVQLQRAVLPEAMPDVAGWEIASYYSPSGRTEVGGDFYDAVPLEATGALALFVGDVMGRGVAAAAAMAQMRAAVRAYIAVDPTPEAVMTKLDLMFAQYPTEQLVTLVYLLVDPAGDELVVANAGHPPPVLLRADLSAEQLPLADGCPLGAVPQDRRHDHRSVPCRRHGPRLHRRPHRTPRRGHQPGPVPSAAGPWRGSGPPTCRRRSKRSWTFCATPPATTTWPHWRPDAPSDQLRGGQVLAVLRGQSQLNRWAGVWLE